MCITSKSWFKSKSLADSEVKLETLWSEVKIISESVCIVKSDFRTFSTDKFRRNGSSFTCLCTCVATSKTLEVCWCNGHGAADTYREVTTLGPAAESDATPRLRGSICAGSLTSTHTLVPSSCQSPYFDLLRLLRLSEGAWSLLSLGTTSRCVGEE